MKHPEFAGAPPHCHLWCVGGVRLVFRVLSVGVWGTFGLGGQQDMREEGQLVAAQVVGMYIMHPHIPTCQLQLRAGGRLHERQGGTATDPPATPRVPCQCLQRRQHLRGARWAEKGAQAEPGPGWLGDGLFYVLVCMLCAQCIPSLTRSWWFRSRNEDHIMP